MPTTPASYEIRICESCGLRYPLVEGHPFGARCPLCMGETRVELRRNLAADPHRGQPVRNEDRVPKIAVLLDNIRSAWNVGSILRSADGFGFSHVFLGGITPSADNESVTKTSLGAENSVPWSCHKDSVKLAEGLKGKGWRILALEEDPEAVEISRAAHTGNAAQQLVLVVGNEISGVDPGLLRLSDEILYIPMRGEKKSFNVAIAFGIAAYALTHQTTRG